VIADSVGTRVGTRPSVDGQKVVRFRLPALPVPATRYAWEEEADHVKAFKVPDLSDLALTETTFIPQDVIDLNAIVSTFRSGPRRRPSSFGASDVGTNVRVSMSVPSQALSAKPQRSGPAGAQASEGIRRLPGPARPSAKDRIAGRHPRTHGTGTLLSHGRRHFSGLASARWLSPSSALFASGGA
jgi:hypothetical protein